MNKYDSFSITHLQLYLSNMSERERNKRIVFWRELKEVLELCKLKNLEQTNKCGGSSDNKTHKRKRS